MKITLITLVCLIFLGTVAHTFAQYTEVDSDTILPEVMLQLELRDSNSNLISYVEAKQIIEIYPAELDEFLDNQSYREFLIKDDKAFEKVQWQGKTEYFDKEHAYSQFNLWALYDNQLLPILVVRHHSYQTLPGDTLSVFWTVIRPAS